MADLQSPASPADSEAIWRSLGKLACRVSLEIPVPGFTVRGLLTLAPGDVIDTRWPQASDVPLRINGLLMSWTEFELIGDKLAARLTELE